MSVPASIIVVGGGPAGYTLVDQLRLRGYRGELTLIDPHGLPMDRPPLSKEFLRGAMSREELRFREAEWFEERDITVLAGRVEEISGVRLSEDAAGWEVFLAGGAMLLAEVLVLASGTRPAVPDVGGLDDVGALTFYDIDDAEALGALLRPGVSLGIIGAGLIGAEAASAAAERGATVTLVNSSSPAAASSFGSEAAALLAGRHEERGITVLTGRPVLASRREEGGVSVSMQDGSSWDVDALLVATGSVANDDLAQEAGAHVAPARGESGGGGVLVDAEGRTSLPGLWAVGDAARRVDERGEPTPRHAHWEAAMHSAEDTAAAIVGQPAEARGARWFWSDRHGQHVEVVGEPVASPEDAIVRREDERGVRGLFTVAPSGELLGAVTFDDARLARASRRLIDRGTPVDVEALADPAVSARDLVRPRA